MVQAPGLVHRRAAPAMQVRVTKGQTYVHLPTTPNNMSQALVLKGKGDLNI